MKKAFLILLIAILAITLTACGGAEGGSETAKATEATTAAETEEELDLSGIPGEWVDLFTFDNVTILLKNTLTIKRGDEYRCVDGKWYAKYQGSEVFEEHNGRYIFDLYLTSYDVFEYDEENSCYKAEDVDLGDGTVREMTISLLEGKIVNITDIATAGSLAIVTTLDFSAYGETAVD